MDKTNRTVNDLASKNRTEFADDLNTDIDKQKPVNTPESKKQ